MTHCSLLVAHCSPRWRQAIAHAIPLAALILALYLYWFALADRYQVFLYFHRGAGPFDPVTRGRYWMAGLVAGGIALMVYVIANWLIGRLNPAYTPPDWWRVWLVGAGPLAAGIVLITMTLNNPTLPLPLALASAAAALVGLALALLPGAWAARRPRDLLWLALDGAALVPVLVLFHVVEFPARVPSLTPQTAWLVAGGSLLASLVGLLAVTGLRRWRNRPTPGPAAILASGLAQSYLILPLAHYVLFTPPGYKYITAAENFLARSLVLQAGIVAGAGLLAVGVVRLRALIERRSVGNDGSAHENLDR